MRVVDTSAWIEWLMDTPTGTKIQPQLPGRDEWLVPTIVQLELVKWLAREVGESASDDATAFTQLCVVVPLTTEIALAAARACLEHGLSTADSVVYATALEYRADVLTCDGHFATLPGIVLVPKHGRRH